MKTCKFCVVDFCLDGDARDKKRKEDDTFVEEARSDYIKRHLPSTEDEVEELEREVVEKEKELEHVLKMTDEKYEAEISSFESELENSETGARTMIKSQMKEKNHSESR